jgi:ketosteroid isomerase-like protein
VSTENVTLARRGFEAVARGELDVIADLLAPDVTWHGGDPSSDDGCHNRGEALAFMRRAMKRGAVGRLLRVIDAGDRVIVVLQPPAAGGVTPPPRANLTTFRKGKVTEMIAYDTPEAAYAAAGVQPYETELAKGLVGEEH